MAAPPDPASASAALPGAVDAGWLARIVDASMDGIISFDLQMRVLSWSAGAERIFGYPAAECIGRSLAMIAAGDEAHQPADVERLARGESLRTEATRRRKDGGTVRVSMHITPVRDAAGQVVGGITIARDVSSEQLAHEAMDRTQAMLMAALRELAEANEAKDRFIATLSHELRNPLASIANAAEVLADAGAGAAVRGHALEIVRRQAGSMRQLVDDLLDVTRLRLGRLSMRPGPTHLGEVVSLATETVRSAMAERRHALDIVLPDTDVPLHVDRLRIAQVLGNLLANAAKYTPHGGRVRLHAQCAGGELRIAVEDNGIGLEPNELEQAFGLFVQLPAGGDAGLSGLGLGLALARSIAQLHGGTLHAESEGRGRGCTFVLALPLPAAEAAAAQAPSLAAPVPVPGTGSVLVVDDNKDALWALGRLLERTGYAVFSAGDGLEALALADQVQPSAMLLDIDLPGMSGLDLARQVRSRAWGAGTLLVALTGHGHPRNLEASRAAGFDEHLTKPADLAALRRVLARIGSKPPG